MPVGAGSIAEAGEAGIRTTGNLHGIDIVGIDRDRAAGGEAAHQYRRHDRPGNHPGGQRRQGHHHLGDRLADHHPAPDQHQLIADPADLTT